ncbi:SIR2 family protein [Marinicellulosiphila megalodicopiae]|uniref:SIR2 family protein n=1 Tax=Marinicellulosiphila megalodicopiae TaxID=2724896 RepID=UPI003BB154B2
METEKDINLECDLAFLKPGTTNWQALTDGTLLFLKEPKLEATRELDSDEKNQVKKNKQHLNDILLKSLQLPNLSFFAGSGTSLGEVGGPSMWDLWEKAMLEVNFIDDAIGNKRITKDAQEVLDLVKYSEMQNPNIEHFLSKCDAYLSFNEDDQIVSAFLNKVKKIILDECSSFLSSQTNDISAYQSLLQKLARRRVRDPRLKVFTTNYDMCFETAASNLGMMVVDGFSYTRTRRFDGSYFNYDVVRRESEDHEFIEGVMHLYKLHGSVSWERKGNDIIESSSPEPDKAVLIYPAKGKYQQAFVQPHLELLSRFLESLRKPNTCLILAGFGFNDDHLSEPIISAIKSNPSLKLIIADFKAYENITSPSSKVSPYWTELSQLAQQGYDIHFINGSFNKFVSLIPHLRSLTPAEQLAKAVKQQVNNYGS